MLFTANGKECLPINKVLYFIKGDFKMREIERMELHSLDLANAVFGLIFASVVIRGRMHNYDKWIAYL